MIRVLIVDDSPTLRQVLQAVLESDPAIKVIGMAANGREGVQKTIELKPDLVTMDVQMPIMDGMEATRLIMERQPTPIIVVSALTDDPDLSVSFNAIRAGALQVLEKPIGPLSGILPPQSAALIMAVKLMSEVRVIRRRFSSTLAVSAAHANAPVMPHTAQLDLVAIGASTGGPAALNTILKALPADFAVPVVIVQHISTGFTEGLVNWLQRECLLKLRIVVDRQVVTTGEVYFAPDDRHLVFSATGVLGLTAAPPVNHVRPSVSVLFDTAAAWYRSAVIGVLLTGMGEDGAWGLKKIHERGGLTIAQDEATSVVYGMPKVAAELGAVDHVLPVGEIAPFLVRSTRRASQTYANFTSHAP